MHSQFVQVVLYWHCGLTQPAVMEVGVVAKNIYEAEHVHILWKADYRRREKTWGGGLLKDGMTIISLREMDARRPRKQHTQGTERHTIQFSFWSLVFYSLNLQ